MYWPFLPDGTRTGQLKASILTKLRQYCTFFTMEKKVTYDFSGIRQLSLQQLLDLNRGPVEVKHNSSFYIPDVHHY